MNATPQFLCYTKMLPIVIYTRKKIFRYYTGFSFFIFIWVSRLEKNESRLIRHEKIHFYQQLELLFVFHWLLYGLFYVISRYKGHEHYIAYRYNPFELEAYHHDDESLYLAQRKLFAWRRFLKAFSETLHKNKGELPPKPAEIGW